jgi:uncharacterized membrane protein YjgN (DUF898 family)
MGTELLKDCPSCGIRIAESAIKCTSCNSSLGQCVGCRAWIVTGTECMDCGKSTAVRVRKATLASEPPAAKVRLDVPPAFGLLPILGLRTALVAAFLMATVFAVAGSPLGKVSDWVCAQGVKPLAVKWPYLWGAAGACLVLAFVTGTFLRRVRWNHMCFYDKRVEVGLSMGGIILNLFITLVVLGLTAGLGLPWLYARYRRSFFRDCNLAGRSDARLDFRGSGEEVLGRFLATVLLIPFALASGGLIFGMISWMWIKWEHENIRVPDKNGQMRGLRLTTSFTPYYGRWLLGWLLSLATAGLYRPWAKVAEWRWMADHSDIS